MFSTSLALAFCRTNPEVQAHWNGYQARKMTAKRLTSAAVLHRKFGSLNLEVQVFHHSLSMFPKVVA